MTGYTHDVSLAYRVCPASLWGKVDQMFNVETF